MVKNSQKKLLITGGAGFIGSNFVHYIYDKYPNYTIYNLDLLTYAGNIRNMDNLKDIKGSKRYFFIKGDICDAKLVGGLFKKHKFDIVVNFAAESHVDRSISNDYHFFRTNFTGVHNLIALVRKYAIPRFIQISTDEIYGDVHKGASGESHPMHPSNPYAASKAAADLVVQSYMRTHKLPLLIVRGSNNYGPYQYPEKLIPLTITNLLEDKKIPIHGDGQQLRRWLHVEDFCRAIDLIMNKGKDFSIYNVAGSETSNLNIVIMVAKVLKKDPKKFIFFINDRPGGDRRYAPDATKIKKELGWSPQYHIKNHLVNVVGWYLNNEQWWQDIKKKQAFKAYYKKQLRSEY